MGGLSEDTGSSTDLLGKKFSELTSDRLYQLKRDTEDKSAARL